MSKKKAIRDRIKDFRRVKASELFANPRNWREHPKAQQDAMLGILEEVGYADALLARELPDGTLELVDGHLRKETTPDQEVPVLVLDIDEDEAKKLLAVIDPLASMAEANTDALGKLLAEIGTESDGVQAMLDDLAEENGIDLFADGAGDLVDPEPQVDRAAELQKEWGTETGQLWVIPGKAGEHRLLCGDSTKAEDVGRVLGGAKPMLMVTDPPYGVEYDANWRNEADRANGKPYGARAVGKVTNDDRADWREAYSLFPGDVVYVWHGHLHAGVVGDGIVAAGFDLRMPLVWTKSNFAISRGHYHWQHEACWYAVRKGKVGHWGGDRTQTTIWAIEKPSKSETGHSTQKPLECMLRPQRNHDVSDVYDPFLGSGTTMVAAENLGRICYGIEISPAYCGVILQRMKDMGLEPRLEDTTQ